MPKEQREWDRYPHASWRERLGNEWRSLLRHPGLILVIVLVAGGGLVLALTRPTYLRVGDLVVGECLYIPVGSSDLEVTTGSEGTFLGVLYSKGAERAACTGSHSHEVIATWTYPDAKGAAFPGPTALAEGRAAECEAAFASYVGIPSASSVHTFAIGTPDQAAWDKGTRTGVCLLYRRDQVFMQAPAKGSGR